MAGTNYNANIERLVNVSLTDTFGYATQAECAGDPNAIAISSGIFANGCIIRRNDSGTGTSLYQNTGTLSAPSWVLISSGGGAWSSITGTPTEIPYFDAVGNGTSDALHTLLADGTLTLSSTFGDMTGTFYQGIEPTLGAVGIWGSTFTNNTTGAYGYDVLIDGTNSVDTGNDSAKIQIIEFPTTSSFYQGVISSVGFARSFFTATSNFEEQSGEQDYKIKINDGTSGGVLWGSPQGMGVLSADLSSGSLGYPVVSFFGQVFADDTGTSTRVATGKDIVDYVQIGTNNSTPVFTGTGTDDFSVGGTYTGSFTGTYTVTCIGNDGARVVFSGGMTTGTQFNIGEIVTGSISGETARVSQGTNDTRIWVYDVTGTGFVNGDILTGNQGNVSTAVTTISPTGGDLMEINYTDLENTNVQWFLANQSPFSGIGGITFVFATPTGHTPNDEWAFTASALYSSRYVADATSVTIGDVDNAGNSTKTIIDDTAQTISGWSDGTNKTVLVGKTLSLPDNTDTGVFEVALPDGGMTGGYFTVTIIATDGTDFQAHSDHVTYAAVNKGGVYTTVIQNSNGDDAVAVSGGTLAVVWTIVTGANKITITVNANSSLAAPTITLAGLNIDNNNGHVVTIL